MRRMIFTLATLAIALPSAAFALTLDEAKANGNVGERSDGYLGVVSDGEGVTALVKDINNQRRAAYEQSAKQNGITRADVEALAAKKAYDKTRPGLYVQGANGAWMKK